VRARARARLRAYWGLCGKLQELQQKAEEANAVIEARCHKLGILPELQPRMRAHLASPYTTDKRRAQIAARTSPSPSRLHVGSLMPINERFGDGGDDDAEH
jgi:hypothetical protein